MKKILFFYLVISVISLVAMENDSVEGSEELFAAQSEGQEPVDLSENEFEGLQELFDDELVFLAQETERFGEEEEEQMSTRGIFSHKKKKEKSEEVKKEEEESNRPPDIPRTKKLLLELIAKVNTGVQFVADCNETTNTVVRQSAQHVIQPVLDNQQEILKQLQEMSQQQDLQDRYIENIEEKLRVLGGINLSLQTLLERSAQSEPALLEHIRQELAHLQNLNTRFAECLNALEQDRSHNVRNVDINASVVTLSASVNTMNRRILDMHKKLNEFHDEVKKKTETVG